MDITKIKQALAQVNADAAFTSVSRRIFAGTLSLGQAWELWDYYLEQGLAPGDLRSCLNRFDWTINRKVGRPGRSKEQVQQDFAAGTKAETTILLQFVAGMEAAGHVVQYRNLGVDNTGSLIMEKRNTGKPDYEVSIDGGPWTPLEIKHSPIFSKCTFKIADLNCYQKFNAWMLLLIDTGYPEKLSNLPSSRWVVLGPDTISSMLTLGQGMYREVGNKPGVQIGPGAKNPAGKRRPIEYNVLFETKPWGDFTSWSGAVNKSIDFKGV
jgi:hypothetical protein